MRSGKDIVGQCAPGYDPRIRQYQNILQAAAPARAQTRESTPAPVDAAINGASAA
jgi:hypothetical protein